MDYKNFKTAIYCVIFTLENIENWDDFNDKYGFLDQYIHLDKVYLETYRWDRLLSEDKLIAAKKFFQEKGIKTIVFHFVQKNII